VFLEYILFIGLLSSQVLAKVLRLIPMYITTYAGDYIMLSRVTRFSGARILVVDDSLFDRRLISTALKKAGFTKMMTADDGADAVQKTHDYRPDLVLLDLKMPNLDGFGYCEMVRKDSDLPKMPIIVQTELEDRQSRLHALSCGADDFLTKPLDMAELTLRICVHIERYFMLRDMQDMCDYLKMEVDTVRSLQADIDKVRATVANKGDMDNHFEVLKQLAYLTTVQ
jgi:DNA-binding response OmpR family regulator